SSRRTWSWSSSLLLAKPVRSGVAPMRRRYADAGLAAVTGVTRALYEGKAEVIDANTSNGGCVRGARADRRSCRRHSRLVRRRRVDAGEPSVAACRAPAAD